MAFFMQKFDNFVSLFQLKIYICKIRINLWNKELYQLQKV